MVRECGRIRVMADADAGAGKLAPRVLVVGGGFAGVAAARGLGKRGVQVVLVDKNSYQGFLPMLYQVASAQISSGDVAFPLENLATRHASVIVLVAEVQSVDPSAKTVTVADGTVLKGDYIVLAAGSQPNFFGTPGAEHAFPMYTLQNAQALKTHLVKLLYQAAENPADIEESARTIVVVGAGATGVETVGSLADLFNDIVPHEFDALANTKFRLVCVDGGKTPLGGFTEKAQGYAAEQLQKRNVNVRLGVEVAKVDADSATLSDGTVIPTQTVVWAGGNKAAPLAAAAGLPTGRGGRIDVTSTGAVEGYPGVFVLGDLANMANPEGSDFPQLGAVALQQGQMLAKNIQREIDGKSMKPFAYHDKGTLAMIGRNAAVAEFGKKHHTLEGPIAWSAWLGVHMYLLQGVRQKSEAFASWAWDYFSHDRSQLRIVVTDAPTIDWDPDEPSAAQVGSAAPSASRSIPELLT